MANNDPALPDETAQREKVDTKKCKDFPNNEKPCCSCIHFRETDNSEIPECIKAPEKFKDRNIDKTIPCTFYQSRVGA